MSKEIKKQNNGLDFFGRYLTIWVALCIIAGVVIGQVVPVFPEALSKIEYAQVSIPVAILLGVSDVVVPYDTLLLSVILFVVIPLVGGYISRKYIVQNKGLDPYYS